MAERTRPIRIEFCVTEQERKLIQNKMAQLGTRNMGAYLRMPTITPQFASGWTRTANRSPVKITTTQRPMRKENACECKSNHGCNR